MLKSEPQKSSAELNQELIRFALIGFGILLIGSSFRSISVTLGALYGIAAGAVGIASLYLAVRAIGEHADERSRGVALTLMALGLKLPVLLITGFLASKGGNVSLAFYVIAVTMVYSLTVWRASRGDVFTRSKL